MTSETSNTSNLKISIKNLSLPCNSLEHLSILCTTRFNWHVNILMILTRRYRYNMQYNKTVFLLLNIHYMQ